MRLRNESGSMILGVALFMAVLAGVVYFYSNVQMVKVTSEYRRTQAMAFAHQIAGNLTQNLRWAYDTSRLVAAGDATACTSTGGSSITVPGGSVELCLVGGQTCTAHPGNPNRQQVCVGISNNTLYGKNSVPTLKIQQSYDGLPHFFAGLVSPVAMAQGYAPAPPALGVTANNLLAPPACLNGNCDVVCGSAGNADCITFKFCPLLGSACDPSKPDDWVFQTVAFLR